MKHFNILSAQFFNPSSNLILTLFAYTKVSYRKFRRQATLQTILQTILCLAAVITLLAFFQGYTVASPVYLDSYKDKSHVFVGILNSCAATLAIAVWRTSSSAYHNHIHRRELYGKELMKELSFAIHRYMHVRVGQYEPSFKRLL